MGQNFFQGGDKAMCSGCGACEQACPVNALSMREDEEGFLFPVKDTKVCIDCGLCERICPFSSPDYSNDVAPDIFAAYLKDNAERMRSSSGGLFYLIACDVIDRGGVVVGAMLDSGLQCRHAVAETREELEPLRSSKYVQSATGDIFRRVRDILLRGREVYFTGTPCQVAGLKAFLRKDYPNLLTSDLICHGVPNQWLFNEHIQYLEQKRGDKVVKYKFRNDEKWGGCESAWYADSQTPVMSPGYIFSPYLYSFINGLTFRYSCYNCTFATLPRQGDITLADFWGVQGVFPDMDVKNGVSMVSVNSAKGVEVWRRIRNKTEHRKSTVDAAKRLNHNFASTSVMPRIRPYVYRLIRKNGYPFVAINLFRPSLPERVMVRIKNLIRGVVGAENIKRLKRVLG